VSKFRRAPTRGRRVELRELRVSDGPALLDIAARPSTVGRWRLAGHTLAPEMFLEFLWLSASVNMVMVRRHNSRPLGLAQAYELNEYNGTCSVALLVDDTYWGAGWPIEGLVLFVHYLLVGLDMRKLYFHVPTFNLEHFRGVASRWLVEEGVLREARFYQGTYHDVHVLTLWRDNWDEQLSLQVTGNGGWRLGPDISDAR
jgi:ribosomal-protein-alanine N-acetyltransferase